MNNHEDSVVINTLKSILIKFNKESLIDVGIKYLLDNMLDNIELFQYLEPEVYNIT